MSEDRIVAVALLTARELNTLGPSLCRLFSVESEGDFADLLSALDHIEAVPERAAHPGPAVRG